MSTWAYRCLPCDGDGEWWVARDLVAELPPGLDLLRVQVDGDWRCARIDRRQAVAVDSALLRSAVPASPEDLQRFAAPAPAAPPPAPAPAADGPAGPEVQAAAISLQGRRLLVVLVPLSVVQSPGEADMLAADLRARLGGLDVVLMGQFDDGTPRYHGDAALLALLEGVPPDRLPWQALRLP